MEEEEEGEVCYYKDPGVAFSYIDEKLQRVLGHFQKDFEGLVSEETLGPRFGKYGTFLPTYQLFPSVISHPKTTQRAQIYIKPGPPKNLHMEGVPQKFTVPSDVDVPLPLRLGSASHSKTVDVSAKKDSQLLSAQADEKRSLKHEPSLSKPLNQTSRRTLRVRIKVGADNKVQKNASIYGGLGLISPSSSMGNSSKEGGGVPFERQETLEKSPASIIQGTNLFPLPGDVLLSPLNESFLCLLRKENILPNGKPAHSFTVRPKDSAMLRNDLNSKLEDRKILKRKKREHENGMDFEDAMISFKKKMEVATIESKQCCSNDLKHKQLPHLICGFGDSLKGAVRAGDDYTDAERDLPVNEREVDRSWVKDKVSFSEKQDANSSSMEKIRERQVRSSNKNVSAILREGGKSSIRICIPSKADSDLCTSKKNSNTGSVDHVKQKVAPKVILLEQDDIKASHSTKKISFDGKKKSKGSQNNGKLGSILAEKSFKSDFCAQKDVCKVVRNCKDALDIRLEQTGKEMNLVERPFGDWEKAYNCGTVKEKQAPSEGPPRTEGQSREAELGIAAPVMLQEDWVCCDRCQKWRLLPYGTKPDQLPEKWLCSMINWLPGMNRCDISEEETTKALHALYQLPLPKNQNNLQSQADRTISAVNSAGLGHFKQSHQNLSSNAMPNQGKKKSKLKKALNTASNCGPLQSSNSTENSQWEVNTMNKASAQCSSKENHGAKEKPVNVRVDSKPKRKISKRESNQNGSDTKKNKMEGALDADKYCHFNLITQCPITTISSCSKISGSHKRASFQEVKGSSVESVSSSPLRISNLDKLSPTRTGISGSDSAKKNGDLSIIQGPRKTSEGEGNLESEPFGTGTEDREASGVHPESFEFPVLDFRDGDARHKLVGKAELFIKSSDFENCQLVNSVVNNLSHYHPCLIDARASDRLHNKDTASSLLKEAEDLIDCADRLKTCGFDFECNETYFQAAQKFLHGASLLENCKDESSKYREITQIQIYSNAAKLCKTCADAYEKRQEMAGAALAYKCMEVALMRVVYCKSFSIERDRNDLQASLQMVPQGESPSSSLSGIDNLNNQAAADKSALSRDTNSHAGNHIIVARNRRKFVRLIDFTSDASSAMEASRKCQSAFAAANLSLQEVQNKEGIIVSVRRVINFSFQDVEELIRLIQVATEAISSQGFRGKRD